MIMKKRLIPLVLVFLAMGGFAGFLYKRNQTPDRRLWNAVYHWEHGAAAAALADGANPNLLVDFVRGVQPQPLLAYAIESRPPMAELLIEKGADPATLRDGRHPVLIMAIERSNAAVVKALLDKGADPNTYRIVDRGAVRVRQRPEHTALVLAVENGEAEIAQILLDKGANPNHVTNEHYPGFTPLMIAAQKRPALVKMLLDKGGDASLKDRRGLTALGIAQQANQTQAVQLLAKSRGARRASAASPKPN